MESPTDPPEYTPTKKENVELLAPTPSHAPDSSRAFVLTFVHKAPIGWYVFDDRVKCRFRVNPISTNDDVICLRPTDTFTTVEKIISERLFVRFENDPGFLADIHSVPGSPLTYANMVNVIAIHAGKTVIWLDRRRQNADAALQLLWQTDGSIELVFVSQKGPSKEKILARNKRDEDKAGKEAGPMTKGKKSGKGTESKTKGERQKKRCCVQ